MDSWKRKLPDYKIVKWDESNFNIEEHEYAKQAYAAGKWAFVSDYARVWILLNYGGIYLDTDYEIIGNLDDYLENEMFVGVENDDYVGSAIMGAEKGNWLLKEMLTYYQTHPFTLNDGNFDMIPNTMVMTDMLVNHGYTRGIASIVDGIFIGDKKIFYPSGKTDCQNEASVGVHYFRGSWWSDKERKRSTSTIYRRVFRPILIRSKKLLKMILGAERARKIEMKVKNFLK